MDSIRASSFRPGSGHRSTSKPRLAPSLGTPPRFERETPDRPRDAKKFERETPDRARDAKKFERETPCNCRGSEMRPLLTPSRKSPLGADSPFRTRDFLTPWVDDLETYAASQSRPARRPSPRSADPVGGCDTKVAARKGRRRKTQPDRRPESASRSRDRIERRPELGRKSRPAVSSAVSIGRNPRSGPRRPAPQRPEVCARRSTHYVETDAVITPRRVVN